MEVRLLGPLEVVEGGRSLALGRSRERALLARLALSANRVVAADQLAGDLWGEIPAGAIGALRVHVSRLRKVLRDAGVARPPGYLLRLEDDAVDVVRFEALVAQARALVAEGDHGGAAAVLREGLGLWRGPALAGLPEAPFGMAAAVRLEEERLGALEERVEADLACGRHGHLVGELEALTRDHPLRERLWAQRMLALYRSGRQAEALRAYQDLGWLLREELGIEPSTALRDLEGAILRHEPGLDWEAPTGTTTRRAPGRELPDSSWSPRRLRLATVPLLLRGGRDLGCETVLVEDREERITPGHRASAGRVVSSMAGLSLMPGTDAVHTDHDAPGIAAELTHLLRGGARFVGVMGSARHTAPHLEARRAQGFSEDQLARLRTAVGLDLGGRTPPEIAPSILAGLVAARTGRSGGWLDRRGGEE